MIKFTIIQKNTFNLEVLIKDENEIPRDLTGRALNIILKHKTDNKRNDTGALINRSTLLSGADALDGKINISLNSEDTDISTGLYKFEISTSSSLTDIETHVQGEIEIIEIIKKD